MIKKKYKILGDSFKQYIPLSKNTFAETKTNKITEKNIDELIKSFEKKSIEIFVYKGHKEDEERDAIGKVVSLEKDNEFVGLYAVIEWFDDSITEKKSFYPSIEMVGKKSYEDENFIYWENYEIKAIAAVEYPASRNVDLLCASAIISNEENINGEYMQKLKNVLEKLISEEKEIEKQARDEFVYLFRNDEEIQNIIIDMIVKKLKEDNSNDKASNADKQNLNNSDNSNKELNLSAITYGDWCNEYAESQNAVRCSSKSESSTFIKARKLFKAGLSKEEIMSIVRNDLVPIGVGGREKVNLSALSEENKYSEIAKLFK
ncbi:phage capsid protein [Brachyspira hyodysenteriae]|uniref:phage capsid protein n=1 Tax=Brachyspira hyodysenteriae TaxID=159 RepID=UPI0022CDA4CA|nr:phage capsid protein [Brachyspira hyodysenteriae]MDA0035100.1 phage capsid protein [Brachyspira hyodysenteriae]MDA0049188.1 phage capsid protein [Brachyspira hyodysenteriae]MDA0063712.1 phage capsid protein [Brachyspira hyodysenteriae]MDA0064726.1 phage capsid protein [Brachyspira hyodysenteriae]MDA0087731.1 phage capsid protein [Brachyspira hyodysenteriae]